MTSTELIEILRNNDMWEEFITEWFDKYIQGDPDSVEKYIQKYNGRMALLDFINIDQYLTELSQDLEWDDLKEFS